MRVLCVGTAVLFMVCPLSLYAQIEREVDLKFTAELPEGVPDSTEWPGHVMITNLNIANPVGERRKEDPVAVWMTAQGICPHNEGACGFRMYADSSGRNEEETRTYERVVRIVVRNESGKLVECLGYWAGANNIVQRQSFWLRSEDQWRKRTDETLFGLDVLEKADVLFLLRVEAILKKSRL
ncbi:MAG: hypothetical protein AAB375_03770 [Patescibacteria group bacterium]